MSTAGVAEVQRWVRAARRIVVLSGAGMSQESGVPTFRDAQTGLWAHHRPEDLATEDAFRAAPSMVWDWYAMRRAKVAEVEPNAGHRAVAAFQRRHPGRLTVVTQNVDDLHQRSGSPGVLPLHGSLFADRWLDPPRACCQAQPPQPGHPPRCAGCGNLRRPGVVWFGEALPPDVLAAAQAAATACELMLVVGTSGLVYPAAGLPGEVSAGARVAVVNPQPSALDDPAQAVLRGTAAALLPALLAAD
ncbi:NAD-dependent protein deacylase [Ramlibacter tataouinensis]|uniref:NAD-dependent protein deacylase n=1 Tax=Ramlibacter tataouinensis (strain ATCC BAA-407 / DSM 14655 / LMG 21543 / TTB310) TaxID=365046 RepID=F5XX66_RAMTT|nr:NAD-dependent protein deacylase [Ramlibacter tataouinensis]AEG93010.1 NAD-dependent protein deacetylase, SIR2 family-like protein [Ramlibacter tataouinensis TTB310]